MHSISVIAAILAVVAVASAKTISHGESAAESERIIGGDDARPGQFPWVVAIYYNNISVCTASIISPRTILCAAHCVVFNGTLQSPGLYHGIANVNRSAPSVLIHFSKILPHPDYDARLFHNDVALFTTDAPIPLTKEGGPSPICIARRDTGRWEYRNAVAMGWGNTQRWSFLPENYPEILQYVVQHIVDNSVCALLTPGINDRKICARGFSNRGFTGACNGDSGGPLVYLSRDKPPVQIGITSHINNIIKCGKFASAVWSRVSSYYEFITGNSVDKSAICEV